jgi:hypothetical protein
MEWGNTPQVLTDLGFGYVLMSVGHLVPLLEGSTVKNEVILCVESGLMGG